VVRRLARPSGPPPHEGLQDQEASHTAHREDARRSRSKKSPGASATVGTLAKAWASADKLIRGKTAADLIQLAGQLTPAQLTPMHLEALKAQWKSCVQQSTLYNRVVLLTRFCRLAGLPIPKPVRKPRPRTVIAAPEEIRALCAAAKPWMRTIILLGAHAGLRRSDAMRAAPQNRSGDGQTLTIAQKKTGRTVSIPLTEELKQTLDRIPQGDPQTPYYALQRGGPITSSAFGTAWTTLKAKAGVNRKLWFHDLRRTLAVSMYEVSRDLRAVEQMLGHTSLHSTAQYLEHRDPEKLRPIIDAMFKTTGRVQ